MKIPRSWADGKTNLAPLIWDLMLRGAYEGFEGCAQTPGMLEAVTLCMLKDVPLTVNLVKEDR